MENKQKRFQMLWRGSLLYALFYTVCLYHNPSGITYPLFAAGTLLFWTYFMKNVLSKTTDKAPQTTSQTRRLFTNILMTGIVAAGLINCTTDSGVFNLF